MNVLYEIHDFIAGGSILAPAGLACGIVAVLASSEMAPLWRAGMFTAIVLGTLVAAVFERQS